MAIPQMYDPKYKGFSEHRCLSCKRSHDDRMSLAHESSCGGEDVLVVVGPRYARNLACHSFDSDVGRDGIYPGMSVSLNQFLTLFPEAGPVCDAMIASLVKNHEYTYQLRLRENEDGLPSKQRDMTREALRKSTSQELERLARKPPHRATVRDRWPHKVASK